MLIELLTCDESLHKWFNGENITVVTKTTEMSYLLKLNTIKIMVDSNEIEGINEKGEITLKGKRMDLHIVSALA